MKKIAIALLLLFGCIHDAAARPVSEDEARQFAQNWMLEKMDKRAALTGAAAPSAPAAKAQGAGLYHVINFPQGGWMIVAGDDVAYPVIAFSETGAYTGLNRPVQLVEWMDTIKKEIASAVAAKQSALPEAHLTWSHFNVRSADFVPQQQDRWVIESGVGPLMTTIWDQGQYYNAYCPVAAGGPDGHVYTGCVATAMAQIMKYHNHPTTGVGAYSYYLYPYGTLSANFGATTYNWAAMPNFLSGYNSAVATLMYHAGVSVAMQYSPDGSGAYTSDTAYALKTYFKYSPTVYYASKSSYTEDGWRNLLRTELNSSRPILYRGQGTGGHAFVCDGYYAYDTNAFHFNWGWSGWYNGYYYLSSLTPGGANFTYGQGAVLSISPLKPELTVQSPNVSSNALITGNAFTLSATVLNNGNASSNATTVSYYLSKDTVVNTSDSLLSTASVGALPAGGSAALSAALTAPSTVGTYYVGACVNAVNDELNTSNNCSSAVQITVKSSLLMMVTPMLGAH